MKKVKFILLIFFTFNSYLLHGDEAMGCREIFYNNTKFCSVSFYELLVNGQKFDGLNIRVVGYLKYESNSAVLSVDRVSLVGTMILDNLIGVKINEKMIKKYLKNNEKLVNIYGKYTTASDDYPLARGALESIVLIQKHL